MSLKRTLAFVAALALPLSSQAADPMKVGFVYVGPIGDHGWSYQHDQGRLALEKHFGDRVETTYVENVSEGADAERTIRRLAQAGNDVIFTTSFGFMNATARVAAEYPDITFLHATGYKRSDNLGTYLSKTYEGRYVTGTAAGLVTETNTIGYIASFPIPEVIRDINSVYLGAKAVNPDIKIKVVWVNTWFDPAKEADAANTLMDQGADVLVQHTDSPAPLMAAEKRGKWGVGQASDMRHFGEQAHLLSVVNNWAPYYINTVQAVMDGTWTSEDYWGGLADDVIQIVGLSDRLTEDQRAKVESVIDAIHNGELHPFTGPLKDQTGTLRVAAGETMSKEELAGMDWYVEGIDATLPK
ncbi:BMP family ABC transporter substrate-binding protein [Marinobacter lutaoensis]|jgi:simple sugar transport system substrate-binding protein|uniref:BMP family ABC transporter substrate-binding protein n=1 Tax=Marinobacter lutaoensis TaxID=135739 RepID=UPI000C0B3928|nr:BMP family ABC transporter substrate-binding protein [Marinobacter lutaoensis]MBE02409.1 BMP family ABC transporter substrate-binding protein [Marinobacter sp.]MBI44415.1 BMP family ABC transporter substrate-binding protein [Oceanospirillales bacterium]NVD35803.1 BMP family ABC transporter substrate-binding protein [Marinobacter lutaoensis]|tara:strand:+ start:1097 stop:2164 length:1068 start_codon:yes stop_codon:yes gene_type:complete